MQGRSEPTQGVGTREAACMYSATGFRHTQFLGALSGKEEETSVSEPCSDLSTRGSTCVCWAGGGSALNNWRRFSRARAVVLPGFRGVARETRRQVSRARLRLAMASATTSSHSLSGRCASTGSGCCHTPFELSDDSAFPD